MGKHQKISINIILLLNCGNFSFCSSPGTSCMLLCVSYYFIMSYILSPQLHHIPPTSGSARFFTETHRPCRNQSQGTASPKMTSFFSLRTFTPHLSSSSACLGGLRQVRAAGADLLVRVSSEPTAPVRSLFGWVAYLCARRNERTGPQIVPRRSFLFAWRIRGWVCSWSVFFNFINFLKSSWWTWLCAFKYARK